jgi:F-type H+-transporting ATPase subunit delta
MARGSAKRFAHAIVELAREEKSFDAWQHDLHELRAAVSDETVVTFLGSPNVSAAEKIKTIEQVLGDLRPESRNLLRMLVERRQTDLIPDIADLFDEAVLEERGITLADITTADKLNEHGQAAVGELLKVITGKDVEIRAHTDPSIIGGIIVRMGDQLIDGSVINQLRRLRARLAAG